MKTILDTDACNGNCKFHLEKMNIETALHISICGERCPLHQAAEAKLKSALKSLKTVQKNSHHPDQQAEQIYLIKDALKKS